MVVPNRESKTAIIHNKEADNLTIPQNPIRELPASPAANKANKIRCPKPILHIEQNVTKVQVHLNPHILSKIQ